MKVNRVATVWRLLSAALACAVLSACGTGPEEKESSTDKAVADSEESLSQRAVADPYADAVIASGVIGVLNPNNAVGPPDGQTANFLAVLGGALTLDMGAGEEGTGPLRIYYRGLSLAVVAQVDFLRADMSVISTGQANLVELGLGTYTALVPYTSTTPYRYVRLRGGIAALYNVDAVEATGPLCGDGKVSPGEQCDDGNRTSGDGCSSTCSVESGYTCTGQPSVCTDINECTNGTAQCSTNATCTNTPGSYSCTCKAGYTGNGKTCTDINECTNGTAQCSVNATCTNTAGSYTCACKAGYTGNGKTCNDINECTNGTAQCSTNATCTNTAGSYTCACKAGYTGNGKTCTDVNECTNGTAQCSVNATCSNTQGSYTCTCKAGYTGNGKTCNDINECTNGTAQCSVNATCTNTAGSYTCACKVGYTGNGKTCTDINECTNGTHTCLPSQRCVNQPGGFDCIPGSCPPPQVKCGSLCVNAFTDTRNCGCCGNTCAAGKSCSSGVCGAGFTVEINATWSRDSDEDLVVRAPTGEIIVYDNRGIDPNALEHRGALPEGGAPPSGTYDVCIKTASVPLMPNSLSPAPYTATLKRPGQGDRLMTGVVVDAEAGIDCRPGDPSYIGSITPAGN
ncbi:EGF domain-containing protein [Corallococcus sp. Z5C101001]|uniref:EGF domain-containing protein n=1 Tax=Corallococcus sp. Z5C101001 TaxID=2596829 RepID=UPI00117C187F|nr:EGF domain-containing protein [Corallococcus sp. Z5C101001]TSC24659.1 DUF4215 domain-containing protein [Corallococcus sp. Z5C101001]